MKKPSSPTNVLVIGFFVVLLGTIGILWFSSYYSKPPSLPLRNEPASEATRSPQMMGSSGGNTEEDASAPDTGIRTSEILPTLREASGTIAMVVQDESSNRIAGATVSLFNDVMRLLQTTYSDSIGNATLAVAGQDLQEPPWYLGGQAEGFFDSRTKVDRFDGELDLTLTLPSKRPIAGVVCLGDGTPKAGIAVVRTLSSVEPSLQGVADTQVVSASDGIFRFFPLPGGSYVLKASDPVWLSEKIPVQVGDENVQIVISDRAVLKVTVESKRQESVPGAQVNFQSDDNETLRFSAEMITDIHGKVDFLNLARGNYRIEVKHDWYQESEPQPLTIQEATQFLRIELTDREYSLSGNVIEEQSQKGVPDAPVICARESNFYGKNIISATYSTISDEKGFFQFNKLPGGIYILFVDRMKGYISGPIDRYGKYGIAPPIRIPLGKESKIENIVLQLKKSWSISGHVFDSRSQEPMPNVAVQLHLIFRSRAMGIYPTTNMENCLDETITDKNGFYRVEGPLEIAEQRNSVFVLSKPKGYKQTISDMYRPNPGEEISDVDLYVKQGGMIEGLVSDKEGSPIANAGVVFWEGESRQSPLFTYKETKTEQDGHYWIVVDPGIYFGRSFAAGYLRSDFQSQSNRVEIPDAQTPQTVNFVLEKGEEILQGIVTDTEDHPLSDIWISFHLSQKEGGGTFQNHITSSDRKGRFRVNLSMIAVYPESSIATVIAEENDKYDSSYITGVNVDQDIHLVMNEKTEEGGIAGQVLSPQGQPVYEFDLVAIPSSAINYNQDKQPGFRTRFHPSFTWNHIRNSEGKFLILGLPISGNPYRVAARTSSNPITYSDAIPLSKKNISAGVSLVLQQGVSITGYVTLGILEQSKSAAGAEVVFNPILPGPVFFGDIGRMRDITGTPLSEMSDIYTTRVEDDGNFLLEGISPLGGNLNIHLDRYSKKMTVPPCEGKPVLNLGRIELADSEIGGNQ